MAKFNDEELKRFVDLSLDEQLRLYDSVRASGETAERELLRVSESTPHNFVNIGGNPNCPMDQSIYKVRKGNIVMVEYEVAKSGVSRAQAGFMTRVVEESTKNPEQVHLMHFPEGLEYLEKADLSDPRVAADARKDLLESALSDSEAQKQFTNPEKYSFLYRLANDKYSRKTSVGIVEEPASGFNDGLLRLTGDIEIDMSNIRLLHIIGVDSTVANAPRTQAQIGDRVEVLYEGNWYPATITDASCAARNAIGVRCDQKVHNKNYENGHGLTVCYHPDHIRSLTPKLTIKNIFD